MPGFRSCTHGFGSLSRFIIVMLSTPPPMAASAPPRMISWAAMAMAWSPEEQKRLTVVPATDAGRPARIAATRATLVPWGPWGCAQPRITSSISAGSSWGTFFSTSRMQWAARSSGRVRLNDPRKDLASGVRELVTTTASLMVSSGFSRNRSMTVAALFVECAALLGQALQQRSRRPPLAVPGFEFAHAVVDFLEANRIGVPHRSAAIRREAVAGQINNVDIH